MHNRHAKTVLVVGATGTLARPVVEEMAARSFAVRTLARNPLRASRVLPAGVEPVLGDLGAPESLRGAVSGVDAVYVNLPATTSPRARFVPERDGMNNLLAALAVETDEDVLVAKLSEIDADRHGDFVDLRYKYETERELAESGRPYLIFRPTWFMDSFPHLLTQRGRIVYAGKQSNPVWWISGGDYARTVCNAIERYPESSNRTFNVQGPEALTFAEAARRYATAYDPRLKVARVPLPLLRLPAAFSGAWEFNRQVFAWYDGRKEEFASLDTWETLGAPRLGIEQFAAELKQRARGTREGDRRPPATAPAAS